MAKVFMVSETTLLNAFNYAVGRMTYVVSETAQDIIDMAPYLQESSKEFIVKEINRRDEVNALGMDMDRDYWYRVREALK